ncbi:sialate O-acetylesterase [Rubritalea marina]|uniref:sialate O-acetylesterase n=1 Tax=Rubritalea marina TaxID=361055 RepID=UPI00036DE24B|nr:sialate O-acetylesterase [Rubritalea marina]
MLNQYAKLFGACTLAMAMNAQAEVSLPKVISSHIVYSWADNIIYNAMIAPLTPYAIKGSIWYQGESNRGDTQYFKKLQALSYGWSKAFRVPNIPLYQVQIAPYDYSNGQQPKNSTLCDTIWAAQYKATEEIEGVELVAIHDTDIHVKDIHPKSKQPVGERLASMALAKIYAKDVVCAGPSFAYARLVGDKVQVEFSQVDRGLQTKDGKEPSFFEVSADGTDFVPASAILQGNTVLLSAEACPKPRFVRMGWSDIAIPNLQDENSWPVFSFPAQAIQH